MDLRSFKQALSSGPSCEIGFRLPTGRCLPRHFHLTEVGKVSKEFVDCGGTYRTTQACVLQTLVASDVEHRLTGNKTASILDKASTLELDDTVPVEVEVQGDTVSVYEVAAFERADKKLTFVLAAKSTACLAPDKCGLDQLPVLGDSCCSDQSECC